MQAKVVIHQFTPSIASGDGVSNGLVYIQKLLKELGYISNIYIAREYVDKEFQHYIYHIDEYKPSKNQILFYHHSIGHGYHDTIMNFSDKKVMIYHNITPPHFFKHNKHIQELCILGREQLANSSKCFVAAIGDSEYNCKELKVNNYLNPIVLPLLVDHENQIPDKLNQKVLKKYQDTYNIIFIGRVVSNKSQHRLIDLAYALKQKEIKNFRIFIIGGVSEPLYMDFLEQYRKNLNLLDEVVITGRVSDEDLTTYYKIADLYLSVSNHEGFGMPLVEAMKYDIPVLAYETGGISSTLPQECLLKNKSTLSLLENIAKLKSSPSLKAMLIKKQKQKLKTFSKQHIKKRLNDFLEKILNV